MQGRKYHEAAIKISIDELESWINVSVSKNGASIRSQQSVVQKRVKKKSLVTLTVRLFEQFFSFLIQISSRRDACHFSALRCFTT